MFFCTDYKHGEPQTHAIFEVAAIFVVFAIVVVVACYAFLCHDSVVKGRKRNRKKWQQVEAGIDDEDHIEDDHESHDDEDDLINSHAMDNQSKNEDINHVNDVR